VKRIGEIAARLVANPVELVAAANQWPREFEAARSTQGNENEPPIARAEGEAPPASNGNEVDGKPGEAARPVGSTKPNVLSGQFQPSPARGRPVLAVIQGSRGRAIASANNMGRPRPIAVARPLLSVIEGGHATGPR
jgi:hypothetical protein